MLQRVLLSIIVLMFLIIFSGGFMENAYNVMKGLGEVTVLGVLNQLVMMLLCAWLLLIIWYPQKGHTKHGH